MTTPTSSQSSAKLRGVNLGGWLVLEKWITPSLFAGLKATDETSYCVELGEAEATRRLHHHWNTFITRDDFAWLERAGINAVRLQEAPPTRRKRSRRSSRLASMSA